MASRNAERDTEICRLYRDEHLTLEQCGKRFELSRSRIKQILKENGVQPNPRQASGRDEFLGVSVTEEDKVALRDEALRRGSSMSKLTSDMLRELLEKIRQQREGQTQANEVA